VTKRLPGFVAQYCTYVKWVTATALTKKE